MQKEEIKFVDSLIFEGMTSIRSIIKGIDSGINTRKLEKIYFDKSKLKKISKEIGYLRAVSQNYGFSIIESDTEYLDKITLGNSHGGLVAVGGARELPCLTADLIKDEGFYAMIQGIEDPYNFGYSIRSLFACGCDGIILNERNWMSAAGVVCRSSAGASEMIPIFKSDDLSALEIFKSCGYTVVCAYEKTDNILGKCILKKPLMLVVGGEKRGISSSVIDNADLLVKIPYGREFNASLSAASASTMFAYEIMRQNT